MKRKSDFCVCQAPVTMPVSRKVTTAFLQTKSCYILYGRATLLARSHIFANLSSWTVPLLVCHQFFIVLSQPTWVLDCNQMAHLIEENTAEGGAKRS